MERIKDQAGAPPFPQHERWSLLLELRVTLAGQSRVLVLEKNEKRWESEGGGRAFHNREQTFEFHSVQPVRRYRIVPRLITPCTWPVELPKAQLSAAPAVTDQFGR